MNILLTGGAGYIGSHAAVVLTKAGHEVVLLDNFCNSNPEVLERLKRILGKALPCVRADVRDTNIVEGVLRKYKINAVIHFAGLKAVGESVINPVLYYSNNVQGSISLLQAMQKVDVKVLVFSSSATVYGEPQYLPCDENHPTNPTNPYGQSKLQVEEILRDLAASDSGWSIIALRYFNPVGAHESGLIGEEPIGTPNNLMPYVSLVASGALGRLKIFGEDYDTPDGTGVRDYIHVMDLADGHLAALHYATREGSNFSIINLGTGSGYSVLELIGAYEKVSGQKISYEKSSRRPGDIACCYANADKANLKFAWKAKRNLYQMCEDSWRWQKAQLFG